MKAGVIGTPTQTTELLVGAWLDAGIDARIVWPREALDLLLPGDAALVRLDVLPGLDGVEPGLGAIARLERRGVRVLNRAEALLAAHDKLLTYELLTAAGIEQLATLHVEPGRPLPNALPLPCVVKPRFGSWGRDVVLCRTRADVEAWLDSVADRSWWRRHGALVQELVEPRGHDLRVLVAGGSAIGSAARVPHRGEWRTNVSLGARLEHAEASAEARALAVAAAGALGTDLVSVDLLPLDGGHVVLELNGAADFDERYAAPGENVWLAAAGALGLAESPQARSAPSPMSARDGRDTIGATTRRETAMPKTVQGTPARVGDEIVITGHAVGDASRTAVILEVLGGAGHEHFRVRWEDGHESVYFPGGDAVIRRPERAKATRKAKAAKG